MFNETADRDGFVQNIRKAAPDIAVPEIVGPIQCGDANVGRAGIGGIEKEPELLRVLEAGDCGGYRFRDCCAACGIGDIL